MRSTSVLPATLRCAIGLLWLEAVLVAGLVAVLVYQDLTATARNLTDALALTVFVAMVAAALAGLAYALGRRKPRARAPAIVLQLFAVMLAVVLATSGGLWLGVPMAVLGVTAATLLFAPATGEALTPTDRVGDPSGGRRPGRSVRGGR